MSVRVVLADDEREQLRGFVRCGSEEQRLVTRARIVLGAAEGQSSLALAQGLKLSRVTVACWRERFNDRREHGPKLSVREWLADESRVGAPVRFQPETWVDILALVTSKPEDSGVEETHWSSTTLARTAIETGVVPSIHRSTVSRFLAECDLKPHRVEGWMNRKKDADFETRAEKVKELMCQAVAPDADPVHVVGSFDEKTGMQAKARIAPDKPMRLGEPVKQEYEYKRNGTRVLLAMLVVGTGEVMGALMNTRTNEDTEMVFRIFLTSLFERKSSPWPVVT